MYNTKKYLKQTVFGIKHNISIIYIYIHHRNLDTKHSVVHLYNMYARGAVNNIRTF